MAIRIIVITDPHKLDTRNQVLEVLGHINGTNINKNIFSLACIDFPANSPEDPYDAAMVTVTCQTDFVSNNQDLYIGVFGNLAKRHDQVAQGIGSKYSDIGCEVKQSKEFALIRILEPKLALFDQEFKLNAERAHKGFEGNHTKH